MRILIFTALLCLGLCLSSGQARAFNLILAAGSTDVVIVKMDDGSVVVVDMADVSNGIEPAGG